jgi:twitching motility protein PilT
MIVNGRVQTCILDPQQTGEIHDIIADGEFYGMQTFDQALVALYEQGRVDLAQAMLAASNPHDMKLALQRRGTVTAGV